MRYALLLKPHANIRYEQSLEKLALAELQCILQAWGVAAVPEIIAIAGTGFLAFEADDISQQAWEAVSRHSSICFGARVEGEFLKPVPLARDGYLSDDIAEVLKYKGKTNTDFTSMALHCASAASGFAKEKQPLIVLDPVCGRGTTLFCALREGHNAVGVEWDGKAIGEADTYFARYLKYHRMKHRREVGSVTLPGARNTKEIRYFFANAPDRYHAGDGRALRLLTGDTRDAARMLGRKSCHLIVGDLPYGVQHGAKQGGGHTSLQGLLENAMPEYAAVLKTGGAIALSFNTYTLPRKQVEKAMREAGLAVLEQFPYSDFSHWVEQAVNRDLVIAKQEK